MSLRARVSRLERAAPELAELPPLVAYAADRYRLPDGALDEVEARGYMAGRPGALILGNPVAAALVHRPSE